jgi:dipicolinate synthase subunit A
MNDSFLIIGGDARQQYLKTFLSKKYSDVFHIRYPADIWKIAEADKYSHIILPLPLSKDRQYIYSCDNLCIKTDDVIGLIKPFQTVYSSGFDNKNLDYFEDKGIEYYDLMKDETFKKANAYLTAQGALKLLLDNTQDYIVGKKALIIGFGDVAVTLGELLSKTGVEVYFTARNERKLSVALYSGYKTISLSEIKNTADTYDYIFGSVPVNIISEDIVRRMKDDALYFELASYPYNADKKLFESVNVKYIDGSALPGRFLSLASGKLIGEFIISNL